MASIHGLDARTGVNPLRGPVQGSILCGSGILFLIHRPPVRVTIRVMVRVTFRLSNHVRVGYGH